MVIVTVDLVTETAGVMEIAIGSFLTFPKLAGEALSNLPAFTFPIITIIPRLACPVMLITFFLLLLVLVLFLVFAMAL